MEAAVVSPSAVHLRLLDAGDSAVTLEFGSQITPALVARVAAAEQALDAARARGQLPGVVETVPTFRSLTVLYDPLVTRRAVLDPQLQALLADAGQAAPAAARHWQLPVCYGGDCGADLDAVAAATGLSAEAVVQQHAATPFTIYMLGFMPGFPFMGQLPEALSVPRRREPRIRVPAGSVAITGPLSCIYPWESPGGWNLLGRCPVPLFDAEAANPVLLAPGDRIRFDPVSVDRLAVLEADLRAGRLTPQHFLQAD